MKGYLTLALALAWFFNSSCSLELVNPPETGPSTQETGTAGGPGAPGGGHLSSAVVLQLAGSAATTAAVCSGAITVNVTDGLGAPLVGKSAMTVALGGEGAGAFYGDAGCSSVASSATVPEGASSSGSFYFKSTSAGTYTLTGTAPEAALNASRAFAVSAAAADHLVLLAGNAQTAPVANAVANAPSVRVVDVYGNPVPGFSLSFTPSGGAVGATTVLTDSNGVGTTSFTLGVVAGSYALGISPSGPALPGDPGSLNLTETAIAGSPSAITSLIAASPNGNVTADGMASSTITITLKDQFGNPIGGASAGFASNGTGDALTQPASPTDGSGVATGSITSTVAELKTLSISSPAGLGAVTTVVGFGAILGPDVTTSTIVGTSGVTADGVSTSSITITLKDSGGAGVPGVLPRFSATNTNLTNTYGTCTTSNSSGVSTCTLAATYAETKALSITSPISKAGGSVTFVAGAATQLAFSAYPGDTLVSTAFSTQPIVLIKDVFGNVVDSVANVTISLASGSGTLGGTLTQAAVAGAADFSGLGLNVSSAGLVSLRATSGDLAVSGASFQIAPFLCDSGSWTASCFITGSKTVGSGQTISGADLVVQNGATIQNTNNTQSIAISLTGTLTVAAGGTIRANLSSLTAASVDIQTGGVIQANGLGYLGAHQGANATNNGLGTGGTSVPGGGGGNSGAGHGGLGGPGSLYQTVGVIYDSASNPSDFGSGGGGLVGGGNGGGLIRILSAGLVTVNGTLSANGSSAPSSGDGGGSGGSIRIDAGNITGTGSITASGGNGNTNCCSSPSGGGGGGRIALYSGNPFGGTVNVDGGWWAAGHYMQASNGTYYLSLPSNDALCDSGTWATTCTITSNKVLGQNIGTLLGANLALSGSGRLVVTNGSDVLGLNLTGTITINNGTSLGSSSYPINLDPMNAATIVVNGTITGNIRNLSASSVTFGSTALVTGNIGSPNPSHAGISATDVTIAAGAVLRADGTGYAPGWAIGNTVGAGQGLGGAPSGFASDGGGGHGGAGGRSDAANSFGPSYGTASAPNDYGSGGGSYAWNARGGYGGGMIKIVASGSLALGGNLSANGSAASGTGSGGGAGGTIFLSANTLSGSGGLLSVVGGTGGTACCQSRGGAGGGGRIAVLVSSGTGYTGTVSVSGGTLSGGWTAAQPGSDGSFYESLASVDGLCDSGSFSGTCTISQVRPLPQNITSITGSNLSLTTTGALKAVVRSQPLTLSLTGALTTPAGSQIGGSGLPFKFPSLTLESASIAGTLYTHVDSLIATTFTITSTGAMYGNLGNNTGGTGAAVTDFTVQAGGVLAADATGYRGGMLYENPTNSGLGTGGGIVMGGNAAGASHGGVGGRGDNSTSLAPIYSSDSAPLDYGSGGGSISTSSPGGDGGGLIRISASGTLTVAGTIRATGGSGVGTAASGGAGGSLHLTATNLAGSGTLSAVGGNGASGCCSGIGGGGGGGRISVTANQPFAGTVNVGGGVPNGGGAAVAGGRGTYYQALPSLDAFCDSGTMATTCTISSTKNIGRNTTSITGANLSLSSTGRLYVANSDDPVSVQFTSSITVAGSGILGTSTIPLTIQTLSAPTVTVNGTVYATVKNFNATDVSIGANGAIYGNIGTPDTINDLGMNATTLAIASGGQLSADGWGGRGGYRYGNSTGAGQGLGGAPAGFAYAGGSYGGKGGYGENFVAPAAAYGSETSPADYGSGGGGGNYSTVGGNGGGMIRVTLLGALTNSGTMSANGAVGSGTGVGAGSGGSIWLIVGSIAGTGTLSANGGAGGTGACCSGNGGAGGGGRISLTSSNPFLGAVQVNGGARSTGNITTGSPGTYSLSLTNSDTICDSGTLASGCTLTTYKAIGSGFSVAGANLTFSGGGFTMPSAPSAPLNINLTGTLTVDNGTTLGSAALPLKFGTIAASSVLLNGTIYGSVENYNVTNTSVSGTGRWYGNFGDTNLPANAGITGTSFTIASGGIVSADGFGYLGGGQPGNPSMNGQGTGGPAYAATASGGSHGGRGGRGRSNDTTVAAYDSAANPVDFGSGGGGISWASNFGGNGGGMIRMSLTGALTVNGTLSANGVTGGSNSGGGGGGSIWLSVASLTGSGTISANGGAGGVSANQGGGGGAGRIAIASNVPFPGTITADGGPGDGIYSRAGFPGTYSLNLASADGICDSGGLATTCVISSVKTLGRGYAINGSNLQLASGGAIRHVNSSDTVSASLSGTFVVDSGAAIGTSSVPVTWSSIAASSLTINGTVYANLLNVTGSSFTIGATGALYGNIGSPNTGTDLGAQVTDFTLSTGGILSANALGYAGGWSGSNWSLSGQGAGFVNLAANGSGMTAGGNGTAAGGHGGAGGKGTEVAGTGGSAYDSSSAPSDYGAGGAAATVSAPGGGGGGMIRISTTGTTLVDGALSANGASATVVSTSVPAPGAGGSIYLTGNTLTGSGAISAVGGAGAIVGVNASGGGGGGRIRTSYTTNSFSGTRTVAGGAAGSGAVNGIAGSDL